MGTSCFMKGRKYMKTIIVKINKGTVKRKNLQKHLLIIALAMFGALASSAQAQEVIFSGFSHSFDNPSTGAPLVYFEGDAVGSAAYVNGAGASGSQAVVITTDFTGSGYGNVDYSDRYPSVSGNTSANIGDYTLSFDAAVNVPTATVSLLVSTLNNGSPGYFDYSFTISNPNTFEGYTLNLGSLGASSGTFNPQSAWWQLDFNMLSYYFGGDPSSGDQLNISNVQLTMVPEPTAFALVGLIVLLEIFRRLTHHWSQRRLRPRFRFPG
jgi:hypothetical protein